MTFNNNTYYSRHVLSGYIEVGELYQVLGGTGVLYNEAEHLVNTTFSGIADVTTFTKLSQSGAEKVYFAKPFRGPTSSTGHNADLTGWKGNNSTQENFEINPISVWNQNDPTGKWIYVHAHDSAYSTKRGHVIAYNFDLSDTITADVSSILSVGDRYIVRDAQNYYGPPVLEGTYSGGTLTIPLTALTVAIPIGDDNYGYPGTSELFNVFIVQGK